MNKEILTGIDSYDELLIVSDNQYFDCRSDKSYYSCVSDKETGREGIPAIR
jgi:hypothetical protein